VEIAATKVRPHLSHLIEQFPSGDADELFAVNFAQDHAPGAAVELSKYGVEEIGHEAQQLEGLNLRGVAGSLLIATRIQPRNAA
jgi:hypothetical protein